MRAYGVKHKMKGPCACEMCGANGKFALKRRERQQSKKEIKEFLHRLSKPTIDISKKEWAKAAKEVVRKK